MKISVIYLLEDTNMKVSGKKLATQKFGNLTIATGGIYR